MDKAKKMFMREAKKLILGSVSSSDGDGKQPKCAGIVEYTMEGTEYSCGYYTTIDCGDCKYNVVAGRKDPEAKCNQEP